MLPYLYVFLILLGLAYFYPRTNDNVKIIIRWGCLNLFIVFFGIRGAVGDDYTHYYSDYNNIELSDLLIYAPGYGILNILFNYLNLPFHCFLLFLSIITNGLLTRFLWDKPINFPFAFLVFFALGGIVNEIDFIRNIVSILFFACSIAYIEERKLKKFLIMNLMGLMFHYSALLYIPMYWLFQKSMSRIFYARFMIVCFLLSFFHFPFLDLIPMCLDKINLPWAEHLQTYFVSFGNQKLYFTFGTIERLLTGLAIYCYYNRLMNEKYGKIIVGGFVSYFIFYEVFSNYAVFATRLANLFVFSYWLLWPLFIAFQPTHKHRMIAMAIMCFCMISHLIGLSNLPQWKYSTFLN